MQKKEDLIQENVELIARLALAEKWMRREVQSAISSVRRAEIKKDTRKHFENTFEQDGVEMITQRIMDSFGDALSRAPKYTLERLIDAEIYWETLQRYPHMDALPVVLAYQKILDAWIEESLVWPWRIDESKKWKSKNISSVSNSSLEKDIENISTKNYTLSIGRWYQILMMMKNSEPFPPVIGVLAWFWETQYPKLLSWITSDAFISKFSLLMDREIFSKKRHEKKVTYSDAKVTREIFIGLGESPWILQQIFL